MGWLLFAHDLMAPVGGPADCVGSYGTRQAAEQAATETWGRRRPVEFEVCEIWRENDAGRLDRVAVWQSGGWDDVGSPHG